MNLEKEQFLKGVQAELIGRKTVRLAFPDGEKIELSVTVKSDRLSDLELTALTVMKLAEVDAANEETTGIDQTPFRVEREEDISNLPGGIESNHKTALEWASSVLMARGWSGDRVAKLLLGDYQNINVGVSLGEISRDKLQLAQARLRRAIVNNYPGIKSADKRRKPVAPW